MEILGSEMLSYITLRLMRPLGLIWWISSPSEHEMSFNKSNISRIKGKKWRKWQKKHQNNFVCNSISFDFIFFYSPSASIPISFSSNVMDVSIFPSIYSIKNHHLWWKWKGPNSVLVLLWNGLGNETKWNGMPFSISIHNLFQHDKHFTMKMEQIFTIHISYCIIFENCVHFNYCAYLSNSVSSNPHIHKSMLHKWCEAQNAFNIRKLKYKLNTRHTTQDTILNHSVKKKHGEGARSLHIMHRHIFYHIL